jgi:NAD(P)-dependent dehydrogenase (short-subunit alcohol dehydrogenase family)
MLWLEDQVALITGGGSGLGAAIVERFLQEGARVGVLEVNPTRADTLRDQLGDRGVVVNGDATKPKDNRDAVAAVVSKFGRLDCFIGNAALWDFGANLDTLPEDVGPAFDEIFSLNVKAYLMGAQACLSALRESRGSIIFTLSNAATHPGGGGPIYTASKHAGVGLVRQLAFDLAPAVRVNAVAPGGMRTDLRGPVSLNLHTRSFGDLPIEEMLETMTPLEVRSTARDYAGHYVLLASRESGRTVTGEIYRCDGGFGIRGRREAELTLKTLNMSGHAAGGDA